MQTGDQVVQELPWKWGTQGTIFLIELTIPALYAYVSELYPTGLRASGFGWASTASRVSSGFVPLIFGSLLWPHLGLPWTFAVTGGLLLLSVAWMAVATPETKGRELDTIGGGGDSAPSGGPNDVQPVD